MSSEAQLGIVIVNYNAGEALQACIESLLKHADVPLDVVVVDNQSSDTSLQFLQQSDHPIRLITNDDNLGFAKACNQGAELLQTDHLAFVNPDCVFVQPVLSTMIQTLTHADGIGLVGCTIENMDGSEQQGSRRRLPTFFTVLNTYTRLANVPVLRRLFPGVNRIHESKPKSTVSVDAVSGAFFMLKTEVFQKTQGFDAHYPLHFEDLDLFKRIQDIGYTLIFNPNIAVRHHKGLSSTDTQKVRIWKKQGLIRFFEKHRSPMATVFIRWLVLIFP